MGLFQKATRTKSKLRMAIDGVSGGGKTFTALRFASMLGQRVAVINTESGAIQKYLGLSPDGIEWQFDICELSTFAPTLYTNAILAAGQEKYDVLIIDSLSHAWAGAGGALELKDRAADGNSFTAWKNITPMHNALIEAILRSPCHIIATMRTKTEFVLETNSKGKQVPKKIGLTPVQRAGMEYEFDIWGSIDEDHFFKVSKSRCPHPAIVDAFVPKPDGNWILPVKEWLNDGLDIPASAFAVTEEDLAKFIEKNEGAGARQASEPAKPLSPMELLKQQQQAKALAGQEAVTKATAPAPTPTPPSLAEPAKPSTASTASPIVNAEPGFCTPAQHDEIKRLQGLLNIGADQLEAILKKRGVNVIRSLKTEQAEEIIRNLAAKLQPLEPGVSTTGVNSTVAKLTDKCTPVQLQQIQALVEEAEQVKAGLASQIMSNLKANGREVLADLSIQEARELIEALETDRISEFFAQAS